MQTVTVQGAEIPALGFGTYPMTGADCERAVETALDVGYRHVDTAQMYDNEGAVGAAVRASDVPRREVFVTTKLLSENLRAPDVHESFAASMDRLDLDFVDLLLIHSPNSSVPIEETVGAMNDLQAEGQVDHIGVSNFSVSKLEAAMDASETPIVTNQVAYHPNRDRSKLLRFCLRNDVALTAYSPLDKGAIVGNETLAAIGDRYGKSAAQVALRWLVQQDNVVAIPKASTHEHIRANFDIHDFELTDDEMAAVFDLAGGLGDRLRERLGL